MIDISQLVVSIDTQRDGSAVIIHPHIENPTPLTLQYRLAIQQLSGGATSRINQQGELQAGRTPPFVRLSQPKGATCQARLEVFDQGMLVREVDQNCDGAPI